MSGEHDHGTTVSGDRQKRVLWWVLGANAGYKVVEIVGGIVVGSLALLADAAHMASDVAGLAIALVAHHLASRPATSRHTFGLQRAEVLGAQANAVLLLATSGWIVFEAIRRIGATPEVEGAGLLAVASIGLLVNLVSAIVLARVAGDSLNMRGAVTHMAADAAGSVAAITAGIVIVAGGPTWIDPALSILIAGLVVVAAVRLLGRASRVLLEGAPPGLDTEELSRFLVGLDDISDAHHVHVWSLASETTAMSAHLVLDSSLSLHDGHLVAEQAKYAVADGFGIGHTTFEIECCDCTDDIPAATSHGAHTRPCGP